MRLRSGGNRRMMDNEKRRSREAYMMLNIRVLTSESPELPEVIALYESAFPEIERRSLPGMLRDRSGHLELLSFYEENCFGGLLFLLNCGDISHIIYFAVPEPLRGQGIGGRILETVTESKAGQRIILDIEEPDVTAPNNMQRLRRRAFYMRHGFRVSGVSYRWRGEKYDILISGGELTKRGFYRFWKDLMADGFRWDD